MGIRDISNVTETSKERFEAPDTEMSQGAKFNLNEETFALSLVLEQDNTGAHVESKASEEGFRKQDHRHVTIIGGTTRKLLKRALAKLSEEERKKKVIEIIKLLGSFNWEFVPKEIYKIEKYGFFGDSEIPERRESYINLIHMPAIAAFYASLKALLKTDFPVPVPHITLFTKGEAENPRYYGIPISSMKDFYSMNPRKFEDNSASHERD